MRKQLREEWVKLTHVWSVRIVFLLFLTGGIIAAMHSKLTGYMSPFIGYDYWGSAGVILFAVIVADRVAGEYQNGRAAKAAAGADRGLYFAAEVVGLFSLSAFFCLMYTAVLSLLCHVINGRGGGYFSRYPLQVAVFLFCKVLVYWVYIAVFILTGVLVRRRLWAFTLSCGAAFLDVHFWWEQRMKNGSTVMGGPVTALMQSEKYIGRADLLSYDFYLLFVPGAYAGFFALITAYHVFCRRKLRPGQQMRSGGLLVLLFANLIPREILMKAVSKSGTAVRRLSGIALTAVLLLAFGHAGICAEEKTLSLTDRQDVENVGELRLVFGDSALGDGDAFVLFLMAEGFTEEEQEDFFRGIEKAASELMSISPYDEFADVTKIYALGTISGESGIAGDGADTREEAEQDSRDTFFGAAFWEGGQDWKLGLSREGFQKMYDLRQQLLPAADFCGVIINSGTAAGTTYYDRPAGNIFLVTLDTGELAHELGHAVARLADEYDRNGYYSFMEAPNMTREPAPGKVRWAEYMGMDDISVYEFSYERSGWYHPSKVCIMRAENTGRFCPVCEDALRENICKYCTSTRMIFSSLGERIPESGTGTDMREYFSVQKMFSILESSRIPEGLLRLRYYDGNGGRIDRLPGKAGNYFVEAEFTGYQIGSIVYEPCILRAAYEIKPDPGKVFWLSVTPLFAVTAIWIACLIHTSRHGAAGADDQTGREVQQSV